MEYVGIDKIRFDQRGLVPAVVQEAASGKLLMVAYMNEESLRRTVESGETWFYSRSRQCLWHKGETSGHVQRVRAIAVDCDEDTLLIQVDQIGAACHTGHKSCFFRGLDGVDDQSYTGSLAMLADLKEEIADKRLHPTEKSYTSYLLATGIDKICKKIGEEATELVMAAKDGRPDRIVAETADLWFHCLVALTHFNLRPDDVLAELARREGLSGLAEKASRPQD